MPHPIPRRALLGTAAFGLSAAASVAACRRSMACPSATFSSSTSVAR